jgi:phosphoenolpyruvate carboxykinase (GTP)
VRRRLASCRRTGAINVEGLNVTSEDMDDLLTGHYDEWRHEVPRIREHFAQFNEQLPSNDLDDFVLDLERRLG